MKSISLFIVFITVSIQAQTSPIDDLCTELEWNTEYFPYRWGWDTNSNTRTDDFYTYNKFKEAIEEIGKIELLLERRCGTNQLRVTRIDTAAGTEKVVSVSTNYNASWNLSKPIVKEKVIYANFLNEGNLTTRKRELAAFFSNISHETTGGPSEKNNYKWGLFFLEEGENIVGKPNSYVSKSTEYPAVTGKSYHGRGPIQLSYNYNYGPASEQILGDKNILLSDPDKVSSDAKMAFMTGIWFWMTPQAPKPSSHDVMVGNWSPTTTDQAGNRAAGLGMTVNIINGGVECGDGGTDKYQVIDRIKYYERYATYLGISTDLDGTNTCNTCGCADMTNYSNDNIGNEDCTNVPSIEISAPNDGSLILDTSLAAINVNAQYNAAGKTASQFKVVVENEDFTQTSFNWTPQFFKAHIIRASVLINGIPYETESAVTFYDVNTAIDCSAIAAYSSSAPYQKGDLAQFNAEVYKAKYWTDKDPQTEAGAWELVGTCLGINNAPSLSVTNNSTPTSFSVEANAADSDGGIFFIDFIVDGNRIERFNPRSTTTENIASNTRTFSYVPTQNKQYEVKIVAYDRYGAATTQIIQIMGQTLGMENEALALVRVYPNPFREKVQITAPPQFGQTQVEVYDFLGRKLQHSPFDFSQNNELSLSIPHAAGALYFLRLSNEEHTHTLKLIQSPKNHE